MSLFNKLFTRQKKVSIEFCQKNLDRFVTENELSDYSSFLSQKNVVYKEYECQSRCKECKKSPYAIVDGTLVSAEDSKELLNMLKNAADGGELK